MAITAAPYAAFFSDLLNGVHNVITDTTKVALLTNAYTINLATHASFADVVAAEIGGAGYTAGGNTLTGKSISYNSTSKITSLAAASTTWATLTATTRYAVIYKSTGTNSTSRLMGVIDFGADRTYAAAPFELSFPSGAVTIGQLS